MAKNIFLYALILMSSCTQTDNSNYSSKNDILKLAQLHQNYKNFWLENDNTKVVNLFLEDGAIAPPGNKGDIIKSKKAIGAWWFTANGDTTYPIISFIYKNDLLTESVNLATWEGISEVGWETRVKDSIISTHTSSSNFITVCKKEDGEWKIYRQIWNVRPTK